LDVVDASALRRFLARWTGGDPVVTEELVRETMRRASRTFDHAGADGKDVSSWLLTLAQRVAIDYARSRSARQQPSSKSVKSLLDRATDAQVGVALEQLSAEQRAVIAELFYRGRSVAEAAALLGLDEATVSQRTLHALVAVRRTIKDAAA
jgi:RNA polymerase sigma-70 factor (ECF subfamily)